jgi:phage FluMu gp28-like protein
MTTKQVTFRLPDITTYQRDAIFCPERVSIIEATTKAGKTLGCILWLVHMAWNADRPNQHYWWVAPVYDVTEIAYGRTKNLLETADPDKGEWQSNDSKLLIKLGNGAVIHFKTAEKPDNLYGEDVYAAVMDETTRCKEQAWHALRTTLTATNGKLRLIGNVKGRKNWAYLLARKAEQGQLPGWKQAKITCYDAVKAGVISKAAVEEARAELPDAVFKELYEGIPNEDGSNPFGLSHIAACVRPLSAKPPVCFGVDLAKSTDWTVVLGCDEDGQTCVFDRWQHEPWSVTTDRVARLVGGLPALIDSTGVGDPIVEELDRRLPHVEGFKFTQTSKQQLMEGLAAGIQQRQVFYPEGPVRQELETFEYEPTRTGVRYTAPEGMHDDCVVALALMHRMRQQRVPVSFSLIDGSGHNPLPAGLHPVEVAANVNGGNWWAEGRERDPNFGFSEEVE